MPLINGREYSNEQIFDLINKYLSQSVGFTNSESQDAVSEFTETVNYLKSLAQGQPQFSTLLNNSRVLQPDGSIALGFESEEAFLIFLGAKLLSSSNTQQTSNTSSHPIELNQEEQIERLPQVSSHRIVINPEYITHLGLHSHPITDLNRLGEPPTSPTRDNITNTTQQEPNQGNPDLSQQSSYRQSRR